MRSVCGSLALFPKWLENPCLVSILRCFSYFCLSNSFWVSHLTLRSFIHLEFIFTLDEKQRTSLISVHSLYSVLPAPLVEEAVFFHFLAPLPKITWLLLYVSLCLSLLLYSIDLDTEGTLLNGFCYNDLVVQLEISIILLAQDCFGYPGNFLLLY